MATSLSITETTVKAHLTAIFRKLGIPDRLRLALMLSEHDRVEPKSPTARARATKR
ncbi:MAG: LuxR C-terminal-related transcriptional regulator [Candidatus Binatia bacterium]